MLFRLADHELDEATRTLRGPSGAIHLEPQVFDVLAHLVRHRDRAVPKSELLQQVWGDEFVSESALTSRIKSARAALGDTGRDQSHIRTVHGFGYQFVAPVTVVESGTHAATPTGPGPAEPIPAARSADRSTAALRGLPRFHSPFRGREQERARLAEVVAENRLVTALGPGGIGKTRLVVEVLSAAPEPLRGLGLPVHFVDFASTRDPAAVPDTIALTLGIEVGERMDPTAAVCEYLAAIPLLVVLDNCEHVLAAAAEAAAAILDATAGTRVLATSRMPLGVEGERLFRIGPLPVVGTDEAVTADTLRHNPAAAMFLDRAVLVDDTVLEDDADTERIAEICRALDGVPLALELAAGRVAAFGLADLVGLLDHRLDVLGDRSSAREDRHRTLRATLEWSYGLLDEPARRLLRFLAVFPGGVSFDCVPTIADRLGLEAGGFEAVGALVDASLVTRERAGSGTRYSQLETLRSFGLEELEARDERAEADELLVAATLEVAARVAEELESAQEPRCAAMVREELPNIRAARRHLADHDRLDELLLLLRRLSEWARVRDANEYWSWSDDLLDRLPTGDPRRPAALAIHAQASWRRGHVAASIADAAEALAGPHDDWVEEHALAEQAAGRMFTGENDAAVAAWDRAAQLRPVSFHLGSAALATTYAGRIDEARERVAEARRLAPESPSGDAWLSYAEGEIASAGGAPDPEPLERAIAAATSVDASFIRGVAMVTLASLHTARGDRRAAAASYEELVRHWLRSGSWTQQWTTLRNVAVLLEEDHPETALDILLGAAADPLSPSAVVGPAAEDEEALRRRLLARVPEAASRPRRTRVEVAEDARQALLRVARSG
ncbi:MAG TPA: winged helix-turn-helix domain-containing protein [Phycicoccus sp.]|nr:winged helix-turn-helix domain-containing protein [Phycicoccus sp.]